MKIYHTETQEDYDALMIELEAEECEWFSGRKPTEATKNWKQSSSETCVKVNEKMITFEEKRYYTLRYPGVPIIEYKAKVDGSLMKTTNETSIVKEVIAYQINTKRIRVDSVIQYREKGKDWVRGLVKFVDKYSIIVVLSYGTNHEFSSTSIGSCDIEIKVEIY